MDELSPSERELGGRALYAFRTRRGLWRVTGHGGEVLVDDALTERDAWTQAIHAVLPDSVAESAVRALERRAVVLPGDLFGSLQELGRRQKRDVDEIAVGYLTAALQEATGDGR